MKTFIEYTQRSMREAHIPSHDMAIKYLFEDNGDKDLLFKDWVCKQPVTSVDGEYYRDDILEEIEFDGDEE